MMDVQSYKARHNKKLKNLGVNESVRNVKESTETNI